MTSRELNIRNNKFTHVKICIFLEFEYEDAYFVFFGI